jgi:CheY-like chemotaxis protein
MREKSVPEIDWLEAIRIIQQRWPNRSPNTIAITARPLQDDKERYLESGMDDNTRLERFEFIIKKNSGITLHGDSHKSYYKYI